ncbi:protein LURP-one-related 15-like isoform X1 [Selaginella moellendorffii]|uniref:protein LURP-one-related 15-like isoform X1 n=1 Tax=Selaginella moellendorffii TaxID=88036 RepID=UPI000D1C4D3B|nr:protein LURP-one-related 15-like isoform X1 [Selaginella moellendorffii]|eukprot:XP_024535783.1 protein LURP-one-related 15-like isoform X1 [Selaginella moellendorffii]
MAQEVVGGQFCRAERDQHLVYAEHCLSSHNVKDVSTGNLVFKVKHPTFGKADILVKDRNSTTVLRLCQKIWHLHATWQVFPGGKSSEMLFLVKESSLLEFNLSMHVFLGPNKSPKEHPDFKVRRKASSSSIKIYNRNDQIIAKIKPSCGCCLLGGHDIHVNAGTDSAFVLSLFLIVHAKDQEIADTMEQVMATVR